MRSYNLNFISQKDLKTHVKNTILQYRGYFYKVDFF